MVCSGLIIHQNCLPGYRWAAFHQEKYMSRSKHLRMTGFQTGLPKDYFMNYYGVTISDLFLKSMVVAYSITRV